MIIDPRGEPEAGKGKGVVLDVLTHFWHECFTSLTVGRNAKTPFVCHDMQKKKWAAMARILVYGFKKYNYFPIKLLSLFIALCLFGEDNISSEFLLASFKDLIPAEDEAILEKCLGPDFDKENKDIIEFLSSLKCFKIPSKENSQEIIHELSHKELIQQPKYIVNC